MAAVPVGYEAFQSKRRKAVTLACFVLAAAMVMGITVFVDSYSVHEWDNLVDVGDAAIAVRSDRYNDIVNIADTVAGLPEITKSSTLLTTTGVITRELNITTWSDEGDVFVLGDTFLENFPNYFYIEGSLPSNGEEIVISENLIDWYQVGIGDYVNYSTSRSSERILVKIVGTFTRELGADTEHYYDSYYWSIAIIPEELVNTQNRELQIIADIDRTTISPFDSQSSLSYLQGIDEKIRRFDPNYNPQEGVYNSKYRVYNYLVDGVLTYIMWQSGIRYSQLTRSGGIILLVLLVAMLSIRYNVQDRRFERTMLQARGATKAQLNKSVTREVLLLAFLSTLLGIGIGVLTSRVAMATEGFLNLNFTKLFTEPLLISIESLLISLIVGIVLPFGAWIGYRNVESTRESAEGTGRIASIAKGMRILRWDFLVIILATLLLYGLLSLGVVAQFIPFLSLIIAALPLVIFVGIASLSIKALRKGSYFISKLFEGLIGKLSASIGIRRIGKEASSAGVVAAVIVLAVSLAWANAVVDVSLPETQLRHGRFGIGGDISFALERSERDLWDALEENLSAQSGVVDTTIVNVVDLQVSQYSSIPFMAIDPEYLNIGYDYLGERYSNSSFSSMFNELLDHPDYAIVTSDIAQIFDLSVGSVLQAFIETGIGPIVIPFRVAGIVEGLTDFALLPNQYGYWGYSQIGSYRVMVDYNYVSSFINTTWVSSSFLCASTYRSTNGTVIIEDLMESGAGLAVDGIRYTSTRTIVDTYIRSVAYQMDRSVDTMTLVVLVGTIFGAFSIYSTEGIRARRREIALLRSNGTTNRTIIGIQIAEMTVLTLISFLLLLIFSPILISNVLATSNWTYSYRVQIFPVDIFTVIPIITLLSVLLLFFILSTLFIVVAAYLSVRINLAESLNSSWAESGPLGGDM